MPTGPTHKPLPHRAFAYAIALLALTLVLGLAAVNQSREAQRSGADIVLEPIDTPGSETRWVDTDTVPDQVTPPQTQRTAHLPENHPFVVMTDTSDPSHPSADWIAWLEALDVPVLRCDIQHRTLCPFTATSTLVLAANDAGRNDVRGLLDVGINVLSYGLPKDPSRRWAADLASDAQAQGASGARVHQARFPHARLAWVDTERPPDTGSPGAPMTEWDGMLLALLHFLTTPTDGTGNQSQGQDQDSVRPLFADNRSD